MTNNSIHHLGLDRVRQNRGWFLLLGIVLILIGSTAIGEAFILTAFSMTFLGWLMVFAGVAGAVHAFSFGRGWGGFFLDLITGVLYTVAGFMVLANPAASAVALTLLIALVLIFEGLFRAIAAVSIRYPHWGWVFFSGVVTTVLGFLIWRQWPSSGLWVIGLYVGINMILNGWSLVMLSLAVKNLPPEAARESSAP
jgi:uncharacterized membrane protein HdeD (DUF308 family)